MTTRTRSVVRGAIVCESLKPGTVLEGYEMRIKRWSRYEVRDPAEGQPDTWTLIEFEAEPEECDALAQRISKDLDSPGWYANWWSDEEAVVVFPDRVFRYRRGDKGARKAAERYARDCGIPESQLDWED